jgi:formylglycine-generating enzyme required for sulfatase activity
VSVAPGTFDGLSLLDLSRNEARNNAILLELSWPGVGLAYGGASFTALGNAALPVTCVTINGAKAYAEWKQERRQDGDYGLPTEWEFEYITGGYRGVPYLWTVGEVAKYANLAGAETLHQQETLSPVSTFAELNGLEDLIGNAWEWTDSDQTPGISFWKTIRGGSYRSPAEVAASSFRLFYGRDSFISNEVGFRIVRKPFAVAAPAREITGSNLSLSSAALVAVRGFNSPDATFSVSSVEVSNDDYAAYLNELSQSGKLAVASGWVQLATSSTPLLQLSGNTGITILGQNFASVAGRGGFPVTAVTWHGANDFARWLSERNSNWFYRLPTEAEWEAAALAGYNAPTAEDAKFIASNSWSQMDRIVGPSLNPWGLTGILASVAEWTSSEAIGLADLMIVRGGSAHWFSGERSATDRSQFLAKETIAADLGFRLARVPKTPWKSATADGMFLGFVDMAVVNEGGKAKVVMSRKGDPVFPMNVLVSCDDSRVQLPASVTFAGGEATKTFAFSVAADLLAYGQKEATITLSPDTGTSLALSLTISDTSSSVLSIEILSGKVIAGQPATLRISRNAAASAPLGVVVATPQGQQVETIPGSQSHVDVTINVPTGAGNTLLVNASADWHAPASASLNVEQVSGFAAWAASHGLGGTDAAPAATPIGDGIPNYLKYAFNLAPAEQATSIGHIFTTKGLPVVGKLAQALRVEYIRLKSSQGGPVYKVLHSNGLNGNWAEFAGQATITSIDDKWENVVAVIPVSAGAKAFARVSVSMPDFDNLGYSRTTFHTPPLGYTTQSLSKGVNVLGITLHNPTLASGIFSAVAGTTLSAPDLGLSPATGRTYILEITSGTLAGVVQEIPAASISGTNITTSQNLATLGLAVGNSYNLRLAPTLEDIFTTTPLNNGGILHATINPSTADVVSIPNGAGGYDRYYLRSGATPAFRSVATNLATPNVPVIYVDGILIDKKNTTAATLVSTGEVKTSGSNTVVVKGINPVGVVAPVGLNLFNVGLEDDLLATLSSSTADIVWVQQPNLIFRKFYRRSGVGGGWRDLANPSVNLTQAQAEAVTFSGAVIIERRGNNAINVDLNIPTFYSNL